MLQDLSVQKMGFFYDYYATLRSGETLPVWTEPYIDSSGAGQMTTCAIAVYDDELEPPELIGGSSS